MNKLPYSYKGRPILSSGRRSPYGTHTLYDSHNRHGHWGKWLLLPVIAVVAALILYFIFRTPSTAETAPAPAETVAETGETAPAAQASPSETAVSGAESALDEVVKAVSQEVKPEKQEKKATVSAEMQRQAMSLYAQAVKTLNEGKYAESRKLIRPVFRMITPDHPLYSQAQVLLGKASMHLYESGEDSGTALIYAVKSGDSLSRIAKKYKVSVGDIQQASGLTSNNLRIGQKLKIPRNSWRLQVDRKISRMMLYNNAQLFQIYTVRINQNGSRARLGSYKLREKRHTEAGKVWFDFHSAHFNTSILCMSGNVQSPDSNDRESAQNSDFLFTSNDAKELFRLIPEGTAAEIIK